MMSVPREILAAALNGDRRVVRAFEQVLASADLSEAGLAANVAATKDLQDATVLVLSSNDALTNETLLQVDNVGIGAVYDATAGTLTLYLKVPISVAGGFGVAFEVTGETALALPEAGTLATLAGVEALSNKTLAAPKIGGLGDYLDDTAAAAGGVPVTGVYRNGSVLMVRVA